MAPWIVDLMPTHHSYLEPFFGSGAVLFTKQRSNIETVNDMGGNAVYWRQFYPIFEGIYEIENQ